ncbi:MAG TPA: YIP1 family protein [Pyrinomonadaceae bacterium]|jgi:hypothetical protein
MRRIVGVIIFAAGLLLLVGHFLRIAPEGLRGIAILSILIGLVVFGLSFIRQPAASPEAPPPLSAAERVTGVFFEPERVFQNLRHHPRWLTGFLVMVLCGMIYQVAFTQRLTPERIAGDFADKVIEGGWIPPEKTAAFKEQRIEEAQSTAAKIATPLSYIGGTFLVILVLAGLFLLCVLAFGGRMNFWQALSVAVYSWLPPVVITSILNLILLYTKAPDEIDSFKGQQGLVRADLGLLVSAADHPVLYTVASLIGVFTLYRWWLTATGFRHTAEKLSAGSAWAIVFILWLLGVICLSILAALFPTFTG